MSVQVPVPTVIQGELALVKMTFTDELLGTPINPVVINVQVQGGPPTYTEVAYQWTASIPGPVIVEDAVGSFHADIDTTNLAPGPCRVEVVSDPDGTVSPLCQTAGVGFFVVRALPS